MPVIDDGVLAGSGLGLAIVTTLADRNHATVTAANHPGGGAILTIRVPAG